MFHVFEGETANDVWCSALVRFRDGDGVQIQAGRGGATAELLHTAITIHDPRQRWIISREPAINPAFAIAEVVWILSGRNDSAFLNYWNSQLSKFAGDGEQYHGAYGYRLRQHFGFDQLERAYQALQHTPDSRQVVLQIWDAQIDFPNNQGQPNSPDIPCNILSMLKVRQGKLEWTQIMRSNDLYLGVPYNVIQFTTIQEILAGWLNLKLGAYHHFSDSLHLYQSNIQQALAHQVQVVEQNTDSLAHPRSESERAIALLAQYIDHLRSPALTVANLMDYIAQSHLPSAFHNLLLIVVAEAARRRDWHNIVQDAVSACANPVLCQIWHRWIERFGRTSK